MIALEGGIGWSCKFSCPQINVPFLHPKKVTLFPELPFYIVSRIPLFFSRSALLFQGIALLFPRIAFFLFIVCVFFQECFFFSADCTFSSSYSSCNVKTLCFNKSLCFRQKSISFILERETKSPFSWLFS